MKKIAFTLLFLLVLLVGNLYAGAYVPRIDEDLDYAGIAPDSNGDIAIDGSLSVGEGLTVSGVVSIQNDIIIVDTSVGIQNAINILEANNGGSVYLLSGNYTITESISVSGIKAISLIGSSKGATVLKPQESIDCIIYGTVTTNSLAGITIKDLRISGYATDEGDAFDSGVAITLINSTNSFIDNVKINKGTGGILLNTANNAGALMYSYHNCINSVSCDSSEDYGIKFLIDVNADSNFLNSTKIVSSRFGDNGTQVLFDNLGADGKMQNNSFYNCYIETNEASETLVDINNGDRNMFFSAFDGVDGNEQIFIDEYSTKNFFMTNMFDTDLSDSGVLTSYFETSNLYDFGNLELNVSGDPLTIFSRNGNYRIGGVGGTNNESINMDFESNSNEIRLTTNTAASIVFDLATLWKDDKTINFGNGFDANMGFTDQDRDSLFIGTKVGSAANSGYVLLLERGEEDEANRIPSAYSNNPVFRGYSSDESQANDYWELTHNGTESIYVMAADDGSHHNLTVSSSGVVHVDGDPV